MFDFAKHRQLLFSDLAANEAFGYNCKTGSLLYLAAHLVIMLCKWSMALQRVEGTDLALEQLWLSSIACLLMGTVQSKTTIKPRPKSSSQVYSYSMSPVNRIITCVSCPLSTQPASLSSYIYPPWRKSWAPGTAQGSPGVPALEEWSSLAFSEALTEFGVVCQGALGHGLNPLQNHVLCKE